MAMENVSRIEVLLEFGRIWLRDDSIVQVTINDGAHIRYREAKKLMETISGLSRYTSRPIVVDLTNIASIETSAKLHFISTRTDNHNLCMAMIIASPYGKMVANLSLLFQHPGCPTRYFNSHEGALHWSGRFQTSQEGAMQTLVA
jgi:hypothetical protein